MTDRDRNELGKTGTAWQQLDKYVVFERRPACTKTARWEPCGPDHFNLEPLLQSHSQNARQARVVLATCRGWPALSASDRCYAAALQEAGAEVQTAAWNVEGEQAAFREADLVVIRSTWDYHDELGAYRAWLATLQATGVHVLNEVATVTRFLDKTAFAALQGDGIATPGCRVCAPDAEAVNAVLAAEGWDRAVLKPINGASGRGVHLVTLRTTDEAVAAVVADVGQRELLVQAFIPEIAEGEIQFVLFDGKVSHAVSKLPAAGEFRTNSAFTPVIELLDPMPPMAERIEALLRRAALMPLYARVDVVMRDDDLVLLEFEVNEPGLWLDVAPRSAAATFAHATMARLRM